MASPAITAIRDSRPPVTDYITYLTILESHLSPEILPELNDILQDVELTQNIGWDLIHLLIALPGAETCLTTIARLGNPREVVLQVTEALRLLDLDDTAEEDATAGEHADPKNGDGKPEDTEKFCILVSLLAILHPRIKTKYPSRFLSTSLMATLAAYRPSNEATEAVIAFVNAVSDMRRPPLPHRTSSSAGIDNMLSRTLSKEGTAPDPEASTEEPHEDAIQKKLIQSFVTHIFEEYVNSNEVEWAGRLQEHYDPKKIVPGKKSRVEAFKDDPTLKERDMIVGQLAALSRDLGLEGHQFLFDTINAEVPPEDDNDEETSNYPSSPNDVPLSKAGCLFLVTSSIFSSVMFDSNASLPPFTIFPQHEVLVQEFLGATGPQTIGQEPTGLVDAILTIGLWLENSNKFVAGPLEDEEFLQHLQTLSLLSANTPSPTLRYEAHVLTSSILHAHPVDRTRLSFISDTLENCPYESLRASAIAWLKEEIIIAHERKRENIFSSTVALSSTQPYIFSDLSSLTDSGDSDALEEVMRSFPFHMAVLNFIIFIKGEAFTPVVPSATMSVAEQIYLEPLQNVLPRLEGSLDTGGALRKELGEDDAVITLGEIRLLKERLSVCMT